MINELFLVGAGRQAWRWDRFRLYADRVRSPEFDQSMPHQSDPETPGLDSLVFAVLSLHHPFGTAFLPGLRKLSWATDRSVLSMLPFLSTKLKEPQLGLDTGNAAQVNRMFNALRTISWALRWRLSGRSDPVWRKQARTQVFQPDWVNRTKTPIPILSVLMFLCLPINIESHMRTTQLLPCRLPTRYVPSILHSRPTPKVTQ